MHELRRTVRFSFNPAIPGSEIDPPGSNGFAGKPAMPGLGVYGEVEVVCEGEPDPTTGYLVDIKVIDRAVRKAVIPEIARAYRERPGDCPGLVLAGVIGALAEALPAKLRRVVWRLTPAYAWSIDTENAMKAVLRQRFDIAAAHRLHSPEMSDEDNRRVYGPCNNPAGHGHNYVFEAAVEVPLQETSSPDAFTLATLEKLADELVIRPFDHKHFNEDTEVFDPRRGGVMPSVENIARVFFERLSPGVAERGGARLVSVTVWETDRTCAAYPA